jgi:hypothetical protein
MKNGYFLLFIFSLIFAGQSRNVAAQAQPSSTIKPMVSTDVEPIICYFTPENMYTAVPLRASLEKLSAARTGAITAANFEVTYIDFSPEEEAAFQFAVDIWAGLLSSDVTIRIQVAMSSNMGQGTLASTGWGGLNANFDNAQRINTWYVVALAEKIAGRDLNDVAFPDIAMQFNAGNNWYLGTDLNTPSDRFDLVTVALHEIGHGLGIFSHTLEDNGIGSYGNNVNDIPLIYTQLLENGGGQNLVETFDNNTAALGDELVGDDLFFGSFTFLGGTLPRIHAPSNFSSGSSIAHLDESTYPAGDPNSLMSPQIGLSEAIHDPGLALDMLFDMGWIAMDIAHERLKDTEDLLNPIVVKAVVAGDNAVATDGVNLHYTFTNFADEVVVGMTATGNPDEYSADIPLPGSDTFVSYFIEVDDDNGRNYLNPGEAPDFFHQFVVAPDTIAPVIIHEPLSFVFTFDLTANIVATVLDNIGVGPLSLTYDINGGTTTTIDVPLVSQSNDGIFIGEYALAWDLSSLNVTKGDVINYKLTVSDVSAGANPAVHPGFGLNQIQIDALNAAVNFYTNDFSSVTDDFIGPGFTIGTESGFSNNAIFSDHPYRSDRGIDPDDTVVLQYLLKTPIILSGADPSLRFDEVVLVEPGEPGTEFGDDQFWDYVVVEGSSDLGVTWTPLADGYDSRAYSEWLDQWDSDIVVTDGIPDSEAPGNEGLFKPRVIDMLASGNFSAGDEILIRFKLFADQLAVGWGWAIDNVKIQIDDVAPEITHIAPSYLMVGDTDVKLVAKVTDNAVLDSVTFEVVLDGVSQLIGIDQPVEIYELNLGFNPITATSDLKYRIIAVDSATNANVTFSPTTGFYEIPVAVLGTNRTMYVNDFNSPSTDFVGIHFSVTQETGFNDEAIHSVHPYVNSPVGTTTMSYLLKYPIILNDGRAWLKYDEIALVDPAADRVVVEASKDNGVTWVEVMDPYSASARSSWLSEFVSEKDGDGNSLGTGSSSMLESRFLDILSAPGLAGGDEVLLRFTVQVDESITGWGWAIDNLEIQGPTTALNEYDFNKIEVYPNPVTNGLLHVSGDLKNTTQPRLQVLDMLGQAVYDKQLLVSSGTFAEDISLTGIQSGFYLVKITYGEHQYAARIVIK